MNTTQIGKPLNRTDGKLKVTGQATYGAEWKLPGLVHGVFLQSTITSGHIVDIDTSKAEKAPGVLMVITHKNAPRLNSIDVYPVNSAGQQLLTLQDNKIYYSGQDVALVIAETFEYACYALSLIKVEYQENKPLISLEKEEANAYPTPWAPVQLRGKVTDGYNQSKTIVSERYRTVINHHMPMEPNACVADLRGDQLILYSPSQWVFGCQRGIAEIFDIPKENVRVISPFVGGAFGGKGPVWPFMTWACAASRKLNRPVKIALMREQMFTSCGHRPYADFKLTAAADPDGRLSLLKHESYNHTSVFEDFVQFIYITTAMLYACPNVMVDHKLIKLNTGGPFAMRAPGEAESMFAIESVMDELAFKLNMDPVKLRMINHADSDPRNGNPWSSKELKQCYIQGAERFGWDKRNNTPRSMRDGDLLVGWGMATALYPAYMAPSSASAKLWANGKMEVRTGAHELGTGTYTIFAQIAADASGYAIDHIEVFMGDTNYPKTPISGGSRSTASIGPAVQACSASIKETILGLALQDKDSPLFGANLSDLEAGAGFVYLKSDANKREAFTDIMKRNNKNVLEEYAEFLPDGATAADRSRGFSGYEAPIFPEHKTFSCYVFGAVFVEVKVDEAIGRVRVTRVVSAHGIGTVMNEKLATSQIKGGIIFGIGQALMEETVMDPNTGRFVNMSIADYHVPVQADVPQMDCFFVKEEDKLVNPIGAKGVGEVGIVGVSAAIANAVFHATGKRIRELPIVPEKVFIG